MADIESNTWSEVASSNNAASPNGWTSSTMLPSQVEPTSREMMAALKRDWNHKGATVTSGGSANVQTLTYGVAPTAYVQGQKFAFIAGFSNSGAATLNVNGLGAKAIQWHGAALVGNEIVAGRVAECQYDGTNMVLLNSQLEVSSAALATVATSASASDLSAGTLALARGGTGQTTALAAFNAIVATAAALAPSGYIQLKDGLIIQWGAVTFTAAASVAVTFPLAFPTSLYGVVLSTNDATASTGWSATSLSGFTFGLSKSITGTGFYIAVGN